MRAGREAATPAWLGWLPGALLVVFFLVPFALLHEMLQVNLAEHIFFVGDLYIKYVLQYPFGNGYKENSDRGKQPVKELNDIANRIGIEDAVVARPEEGLGHKLNDQYNKGR